MAVARESDALDAVEKLATAVSISEQVHACRINALEAAIDSMRAEVRQAVESLRLEVRAIRISVENLK